MATPLQKKINKSVGVKNRKLSGAAKKSASGARKKKYREIRASLGLSAS